VAVYWRGCHWRKKAEKSEELDPTPGRGAIGEALAEPDRDRESQDQTGGHHVDNRRLIWPEEIVEDPLREGLDAWA